MTTNPTDIAANGRRLLDALQAWPTAPDNAAVLAACAAVRAANDPADPMARAECEVADAIEVAVDIGDSAVAWENVQTAIQKSNAVMRQANERAFKDLLDKVAFNNVTAAKVDQLADVGRALNRQAG